MAYPSNPPSAIPTPFALYHKPIRTGCCSRVYHMPVMITKAGSAVDSAAPDKKRRIIMSLKSRDAACAMRSTPHRKICAQVSGGERKEEENADER